MSVDTLSLASELRAADLAAPQAEAIAAAIGRAVAETAATKADLTQLGTELRGEIAQLGAELSGEIARSTAELSAEIARSEAKAEAGLSRLVFWLVGTTIAVGGLVVASIKLLPALG